ncbi:sensor histidine kinase [Paenibacillus sp. S150]|uniref:cache domain-containing sensor histidine kinase n=1 Tax=Paenibacillus sp. S150 TaxID=2749826 RepID=UPI001C598849|nr:sensor histidine kinase [Paenibacillus sp. S150]MBW4080006.1 histidine kinase [Paenibacillus sp. S150]
MGHFRRTSLTKQFLYLILMMLVILLISFIISNTIAKGIVENKVSESAGKILYQVEEKMESFYDDMEKISVSTLYSPTVQAYLDSEDILSQILRNDEVLSVFSNTFSLKENIKGIQLYDKSGKLVVNVGVGPRESIKFPPSNIEYSGLLTDPDTKQTIQYYSIVVPIFNLENTPAKDYKGTCIFIMDVRNLVAILKNAKITENSQLLLLDRHKTFMANKGKTLHYSQFQLEKWKEDKRYIVHSSILADTGWELISIIPKKELLHELDIIQKLNIATYMVLLGVLSLFLITFFTRILKPVKTLIDFMKSYPRIGRESRIIVTYHNEIGVLAFSLNKMLDEIDSLSHEVQVSQKRMYDIEIAKKQMEILAYRNQINPHFLYNTLECVRAMAFYYQVQDIAEISSSLSNMFRYSVKGSDFVTIQEEISHVEEYAKIIQFRFMGKIKIIIDVDKDLLKLKTAKMLLQPIVENAVFHGLERKLENGFVRIHIVMLSENQIKFVIHDNGIGMEKKELDKLAERLELFESSIYVGSGTRHGIGLSNIYWRLKLLYEEKATMVIESKLGSGTTIIILFPLQEMNM